MLPHVDSERARWRFRLDSVADRELVMEVGRHEAGRGARLLRTLCDPLDREAVVVDPGSVRQRIGTHDGPLDTRNVHSNGQVLSRMSFGAGSRRRSA